MVRWARSNSSHPMEISKIIQMRRISQWIISLGRAIFLLHRYIILVIGVILGWQYILSWNFWNSGGIQRKRRVYVALTTLMIIWGSAMRLKSKFTRNLEMILPQAYSEFRSAINFVFTNIKTLLFIPRNWFIRWINLIYILLLL